jgi:Na+-translocating ferredoxin:NAD+ oxidoreductase RnfD subunit
LFEYIDARCQRETPRYAGSGFKGLVLFLLAPHMTATTMAFLLYTNDRVDALVFAVVAAIASKHLLRSWDGSRFRHFMNPSNFGIALVFNVFPWVNLIPYQFTESFGGVWDWVVVGIMVALGSRLNILLTGRYYLIGAWLVGFVAQALIRSGLGSSIATAELFMMTGPAFALFTFYMITDPQTSPSKPRSQIAFGLGIAAVYGLLMSVHLVFALFFAVTIVCATRGVYIIVTNNLRQTQRTPVPAEVALVDPAPVLVAPAIAAARMEVRQ